MQKSKIVFLIGMLAAIAFAILLTLTGERNFVIASFACVVIAFCAFTVHTYHNPDYTFDAL